VGQGGTSVSVVGSTITVSSSVPPFNDIFGQGATTVTVTGGQVAISSSFSPVTQILGVGAVTVTHVGGVWTVSGSGGSGGAPITSISGSGGISATAPDVNGNVIVSGTIAAFASASYIVVALDAQNPNERRLIGAGGTTVTDQGAGSTITVSSSLGQSSSFYGQGGTSVSVVGASVTISSSLPPFNDIFGQGGTSVTVTGGQVAVSSSAPPFNNLYGVGGTKVTITGDQAQVSSSVVTVVGAGGTTVTTGGGTTFTVSSSAPPFNDIFGQGGTTVTVTGGQVAVSSSAPPFNNLYGVGGTKVTITGDQAQVSSSIVTVVGAGGTTVTTGGGTTFTVSSSIPPFNDIFGQGGTTVTITGGQVAVSSSIGAQLQGSYVEVAADAQNTNSRRLVAGAGITLTDGGAGSTLTVATSGGSGGSTSAISSSVMSTSITVPALLSGSMFIMVKSTNTALTATLPNPASYPNSLIVFKDIQGFASASSLSAFLISPTNTQTTIDALTASYTFASPWGSKGFISPDGISWFTVF
jgi:hypothetical protein